MYYGGGTPEDARLGALHSFFLAKEWFTENEIGLNESKTLTL